MELKGSSRLITGRLGLKKEGRGTGEGQGQRGGDKGRMGEYRGEKKRRRRGQVEKRSR